MSSFRAERNLRARQRLEASLPAVFPAPVVAHALAQSWTPDLPRLAVESYWRSHPLRADRLARCLAARSGSPEGWRWTLNGEGQPLPATFRVPPAPYRAAAFAPGPGRCCICGQPVFRLGWHRRDLWGTGETNTRARWHAACVAAWKVWTAPAASLRMLGRLQQRKCALTGARLLRTAEADHIVPLHRVWREHRDLPWPDLIGYWGFPNLQAINKDAHRGKTAAEAALRRSAQARTEIVQTAAT